MTTQFGPFRLNPDRRELLRDSAAVSITPKVFDILVVLVENRDRVMEKSDLLNRLWPDGMVEEATLVQTISMLRKVLGCGRTPGQRYIATIPGRGYRFVAEVSEVGEGGVRGEVRNGASQPILEPSASTVADLEKTPDRSAPRARSRGRYAAGAALAAALLALAGVWFGLRAPARITPEAALAPVPLTTYPGMELSPSFSPDGNEVAFAWNGPDENNYDIYRKLIGPGEPLRLTSHPAIDYCPSWSPDSHHIAFLRDLGGGKAGVFLIPALAGTEQQLTKIHAYTGGTDPRLYGSPPAWSPDGKWLVVPDKPSPSQPHCLFLLNVASREKRQITHAPENFSGDHSPSFSPDGRALVFARSTLGASGDFFLLPLSEQLQAYAEPKRLTFENGRAQHPVWLPHGRELVVSFSPDGANFTLWRLPALGAAGLTRLVGVGLNARQPSVSRSGSRLTYTKLTYGLDIWRSRIGDETVPPVRLASSTWREALPSYSPDGKRIAFESSRSGSTQIWIAESDGSSAVQLTSFGESGCPRWSPDGGLIAFNSTAAGQSDIYVVSAAGGLPRRLTSYPADDYMPSWSQDSRWIYFTSSRSGQPQVWKIPAEGGDPKQITKHGGVAPVESPDGKLLYYAKDSWVTSLWQVPSCGGSESQILDSAHHLKFTVANRGIYFIPGEDGSIQFFDFASRQTKLVARIGDTGFGLSVSPDEKWALYIHVEHPEADLMLVESFR